MINLNFFLFLEVFSLFTVVTFPNEYVEIIFCQNLFYFNISLSILVNVPQNLPLALELHMAHAFQVLNVLQIVEQQMEIVLQDLVCVVIICKYYF